MTAVSPGPAPLRPGNDQPLAVRGYRRVFRVITAVWGAGFLLEAALRVAIVYNSERLGFVAASAPSPEVTNPADRT